MPGVVTGTSGTKATVSLIKDTNCCGGEPLIKQLAENGYSLGNPNAQKPPVYGLFSQAEVPAANASQERAEDDMRRVNRVLQTEMKRKQSGSWDCIWGKMKSS